MLRFLMNFLPQEKRPTMVFPFFESRLKDAYTVLDTHFKHNKWITADYPTMAGFSCCGHLYYPESFDFERAGRPYINDRLNRIPGLESWKHPYELMQRGFTHE